MNSISIKRESIGTTALIGISVVTPMVYHILGMRGIIYLPIFLGIVIGSHFMSPVSLLTIGFLSPVVNNLLTGMPSMAPYPMLQLLIFEGIVLALSIVRFRNSKLNPLLRIILPILIARLSVVLILPVVHMGFSVWANNLFIGLPGITLNTAVSFIVYNYALSKNT